MIGLKFCGEYIDTTNCENLIDEYLKLRKENGITQEKEAELIDTDASTLSNYERKKRIPSLLTFTKMVNVMGYELQIKKKDTMEDV